MIRRRRGWLHHASRRYEYRVSLRKSICRQFQDQQDVGGVFLVAQRLSVLTEESKSLPLLPCHAIKRVLILALFARLRAVRLPCGCSTQSGWTVAASSNLPINFASLHSKRSANLHP